jgi:ATP-dependent DNA helicase RecQ
MMHPQRRKLAGRGAGDIYDQLLEVQSELSRGALGTDRPLSCSAAQLAKVALLCGADASAIERLLGDKRAERFGAAFLDVLRAAD